MGRHLGQHWLKNDSVVAKIIDGLEIGPGQTIIEIGPGRGALTKELARVCQEQGADLIAIEKDPSLFRYLFQAKFPGKEKLRLVGGDVLDELEEVVGLVDGGYKIVGNLPYYITGKILRKISELKNKPSRSILMMQKEVGLRLSAEKSKMNLLAAAVQVWADPGVICSVLAEDFVPPPKVDSVVIRLETKKDLMPEDELEKYYQLIRAAFSQPRKVIANNLSNKLEIDKKIVLEKLAKIGAGPKSRAQEFSVDQLAELANEMLQ